MPIQELERGHLSTLPPSAENKPLQPPESSDYNHNRLVKFTGNLQTSEDLHRAGWDSFAEIKRFIGDVNLGLIKGLTLQEAVAFSTQIFVDHVRFHDAEFTRQESVLPHHNYFGFWQGEKRWLGNNGRPVVHGVDKTERWGAPWRAAEKTEELLLEAENNSLVISVSAQGPSGYLDENGRDVPHLNTLVLADYKDKQGNLQGATFVTDLIIDQAEQLMANLGAPANFPAKRGSEMQCVVNLLENPAVLSLPERYHNPLEFVIDQLVVVRGEGDIHLRQKSGPDETRSIAQIRRLAANTETVLDLNATKDRLIKELQEYILANYQMVGTSDFQQAIVEMAEETVLLFTKDYRKNHKNNPVEGSVALRPQYIGQYAQDDKEIVRLQKEVDRREYFQVEIAFLQSRAGCPSNNRVSSGSTSSIAGVSVFGESDSMGSLYFPCPVCGSVNKRPREGFVERCQSCGSGEVACKPSSAGSEKKQEKNQKDDYELPKAA